jgi:sodium/potassium-transporting ATPase subunit alpha
LQFEALKQAQSAFYLAILVIQLFNLMACKARDHYPVGKFIFRNEKTWLAMFGGTVLGILIVYTPFTNGKLQLDP